MAEDNEKVENEQPMNSKPPEGKEAEGVKNEAVSVTIPETELTQLKKDAVEYKDKYLRQLAEMENMRKRMQKERQELLQYAVQNVIVDFLNPIDQFENALSFTQQMSPEVKHWASGFQMILSQFKDVLNNNGVSVLTSEGTPFDPHRHEAVEMVSTKDYAPGTVVSESVRGYKMGEKIIRPARVRVSKSPEEAPAPTSEVNSENKNHQNKQGA